MPRKEKKPKNKPFLTDKEITRLRKTNDWEEMARRKSSKFIEDSVFGRMFSRMYRL